MSPSLSPIAASRSAGSAPRHHPAALQFATDAGGADAESHRQQAKDIMRRIDARAPSRMSIDAGPNYFCYLVEDGMVFLSLAERAYPRKLAFAYLADVHRAFADELFHEHGPAWRAHIDTASKPYAFLKFGASHARTLRQAPTRAAAAAAAWGGDGLRSARAEGDAGERAQARPHAAGEAQCNRAVVVGGVVVTCG